MFRSSTCLLLVLGCNTLSAVSYMVRITATPYIFTATKVVAYAEILVYMSVPLVLPVRMICLKVRQKISRDSNVKIKAIGWTIVGLLTLFDWSTISYGCTNIINDGGRRELIHAIVVPGMYGPWRSTFINFKNKWIPCEGRMILPLKYHFILRTSCPFKICIVKWIHFLPELLEMRICLIPKFESDVQILIGFGYLSYHCYGRMVYCLVLSVVGIE